MGLKIRAQVLEGVEQLIKAAGAELRALRRRPDEGVVHNVHDSYKVSLILRRPPRAGSGRN